MGAPLIFPVRANWAWCLTTDYTETFRISTLYGILCGKPLCFVSRIIVNWIEEKRLAVRLPPARPRTNFHQFGSPENLHRTGGDCTAISSVGQTLRVKSMEPRPKKPLDQVRNILRLKHYTLPIAERGRRSCTLPFPDRNLATCVPASIRPSAPGSEPD